MAHTDTYDAGTRDAPQATGGPQGSAVAQAARAARPLPLMLAALLLAAAFVAGAVGTTQAVIRFIGESVHIIDTAGVAARIVEDYDEARGIYPGATVDKVVNVTNTGEADVLVRARAEKRWGTPAGGLSLEAFTGGPAATSAPPVSLAALPTDNITIHYNETMWLFDPADGWFYYKGVLAPGQTTSEPLFASFTVDAGLGNEYQGLEAFITVRMECVQAAGGGIALWGKELSSLGILSYASQLGQLSVTRSTFVGETPVDFVFDPVGTDLFANFKRLMPGETRSQAIEVANAYTREVEIFLRAEDIAQGVDPRALAALDTGAAMPAVPGGEAVSPLFDTAALELIDRLLREHVVIVVTDASGATVYDGPVWGRPDADEPNPHAMRNDISLGAFAPGEMRTLTVQLQVDPTLGNEYQDLMGLIHWVWTAELQEEPPPPPPPAEPPAEPPVVPVAPPAAPKTGDVTGIVLWASLMVLSGAALLFLAVYSRRVSSKRPE